MKKHSLIVLFALFVSLIVGCATSTKSLDNNAQTKISNENSDHYLAVDFFILGNNYYRQNLKDIALHAYEKALKYDTSSDYLRWFVALRAFENNNTNLALHILNYRRPKNMSVRELKLLGEIYIRKGMLKKAKQIFKLVIEKAHDDAEAHYALGLIYKSLQKSLVATEEIRKANRIRVGDTFSEERAALMYMKDGRLDSARVILERMVNKNPKEPRYKRSLASVYEATQKDSIAVKLYKELLKENSNDEKTLLALGSLFLAKGKWQKAFPYFRKLNKLNPNKRSIIKMLGVLNYETKKYAKAESLFTTIASEDKSPEIHYYLGSIYLRQGSKLFDKKDTIVAYEKFDQALIELNKVISIDNEFMEAWIQLGLVYIQMNDIDSAVKIYKQALNIMPKKPQLYYMLGIAYEEIKNREKAIESFLMTVKYDSKNIDAFFELGSLYERTGKFKKAVKSFKKAIKLDSLHALSLNYLGYMMVEKGVNLKEATSYIARALKLEPDNPAILDSYGWAMYKLGNYKEALKYLLKAVSKLNKMDYIMLDHVGDVYQKLNDMENAKKYWGRALELKPDDKNIKSKILR